MRIIVIFCALILSLAVGLQVVGVVRREPEPVRPLLAEILPAHLNTWRVTDEPIAESAEMKKAVGELLNFDEAIYRTYRRGSLQFDVYAAYWRPGKMSERLVAGHSPDVCWVAAGWKLVSREIPSHVHTKGFVVPPGGQYRLFNDTRGVSRWVSFWHVAGGRHVDYGSQSGVPPWWSVFSDLASRGLDQRGSQYFVRVSTNVPWNELTSDEGFRAVMQSVHRLLN
jgi:hypothetical protein